MTGLGMGLGIIANRRGGASACPIAASVETDDAYYNNVAFMVDADGQLDGTSYTTDESRHGHTIAYNGNAAVSSGVFAFDGTGDYLEITDGNDVLWTPGSGFTIELRGVVFDSLSTRNVLFSSLDYTNGESFVFRRKNGNLGVVISTDGAISGGADYVEYPWTPGLGQAYDLTLTWDGSTIRLYIDGLFAASEAFSGMPFPAQEPLRVGCDFDLGAARDFFDGSIRAIRFTKGVARWTNDSGCYTRPKLPYTTTQAATTDSEWGNVVLLVTVDDDGSIRDASPYDWAIIQGGNVGVSTSVEPFADANSTTYDGSTDFLRIPHNPYIELGSGDYTVELFARHSINNDLHFYAGQYDTVTNNRQWAFAYRGELSPDRLRELVSSNGTSFTAIDSATFTPSTSTFYHVATCRNGSNRRIFVDGTQSGSTNTSGTNIVDAGQDLYFGAQNGSANSMSGYLSEMRITKAARYTANFTAPSAVFPRG